MDSAPAKQEKALELCFTMQQICADSAHLLNEVSEMKVGNACMLSCTGADGLAMVMHGVCRNCNLYDCPAIVWCVQTAGTTAAFNWAQA